ncbi:MULTISPECIES: hypothetical protein [Pseudoalteromonas]|uniref:hypothetical protein n=1 Tax=Pseudoalteromonas TaxID=53246 RepID=UPI0019D2B7D1|nr:MULTISPECIES: hypothetical protein [Pseudoalteromonas]MBR8845369.1 hypothetical protein [Pseudoalteromonas sp. JC3]QUI71584.1 hypothetical protein GSF13_18360 [Pseudoalteromonas sp. M8]UDM61092.1 hypothetical protein KIJ96_14955 [Pseudoalteromonas piscicida]WJE07760.1 hypothetical protein QSH61_12755 [Pseudoalteromonas sp. JC3]
MLNTIRRVIGEVYQYDAPKNGYQIEWGGVAESAQLTVLVPCLLTSDSLIDLYKTLESLFAEVELVLEKKICSDVQLVVAAQYHPAHQHESDIYIELLQGLLASKSIVGLTTLLISMDYPNKIDAINTAVELARQAGSLFFCWCDDDIKVSSGSLGMLVDKIKSDDCHLAGCRKVLIEQKGQTLWSSIRNSHNKVNKYPQAYLAFKLDKIDHQFDSGVISDDTYLTFANIFIDAEPMNKIAIVEQAVGEFQSGATPLSNLKRLRRLVLSNFIVLSRVDESSAKYAFNQIIFKELMDKSHHSTAKTRLIKRCLYGLYGLFLAEITVRYWLKKPIRQVGWYGHSGKRRPT